MNQIANAHINIIHSKNNIPIAFTQTGKIEAIPLILIHSGGFTHLEWQPQLSVLEKFYHVICIDQPGHGASGMQSETLTLKECGLAVIEVMNYLAIEKAVFCGSSLGGATVFWLAMNYPEKIIKMALYRVNYHKNREIFNETLKMANPDYWVKVGLDHFLAKLHEAQGDLNSWKKVIQRVSQALNPKSSDHFYSLDDLKKIAIETLLICGDRDPLVPIEDLILMYQHLPNADLWILPHASHVTATNTWRANSFAEELHRFIIRTRKLSI